jgi:sugar lactone lactonase YvrE
VISIGPVELGFPDSRFNDAKVDPFSKLWAGTMDDLDARGIANKQNFAIVSSNV